MNDKCAVFIEGLEYCCRRSRVLLMAVNANHSLYLAAQWFQYRGGYAIQADQFDNNNQRVMGNHVPR